MAVSQPGLHAAKGLDAGAPDAASSAPMASSAGDSSRTSAARASAEGFPSPRARQVEQSAFGASDLPRRLGRYALLRRIAKGGMGEVYLATAFGLAGAEKPVVVKVIRREHVSDRSFLARFMDEARVQAQLNHSGVVQVVDANTDESSGEPYVVLEYVEGRSLGDIRARALQQGESVAWHEAVALGVQIAEALAYVHTRKDAMGRPLAIVHRDLSPQNIMVSYEGEAKLIDFGTARGQNRKCHTVAGVVFAKPGYVAPEVADGDPGDGRVDLYALGVMIWELCAGKRFLQGDASEHMRAVARGERNLPPVASKVGAPAELDEVLAKLTSRSRDDRHPIGRDAARELAGLLAGAPALASGERGIKARTQSLVARVLKDEAPRARRAFARLIEQARPLLEGGVTPVDRRMSSESLLQAAGDGGESVLAGTRYRLVQELGRGASSIVYEAEHVDLGRKMAVKVLSVSGGVEAAAAERFRREAQTLSQLASNAIVKLHDFGCAADGRLYSVLELCDGETLRERLTRERGMDFREALELARELLMALGEVHEQGFVHRDIKPQNLFLLERGGLKILDFGLAVPLGEEPRPEGMSGMTLFGTPEYMAPEQATASAVDERSDIYAVGCVLYEILSGELPFQKESAALTLEAKIKGSPESLLERAAHRAIPTQVDELVMRALSRHPSMRFGTTEEMIAAIDAAIAAPPAGRAKRRRTGYAAIGVAALACVGILWAALPLDPGKLFQPGEADAEIAHEAPETAPLAASPDAEPAGNEPRGASHEDPNADAAQSVGMPNEPRSLDSDAAMLDDFSPEALAAAEGGEDESSEGEASDEEAALADASDETKASQDPIDKEPSDEPASTPPEPKKVITPKFVKKAKPAPKKTSEDDGPRQRRVAKRVH